MKKLELIIIVCSILLVSFSNSNAQKFREKQKVKNNYIHHLNLTDVQKEDFIKIRFAHEEVKIKLKAELKMNALEIKKLLNEKNLDENKLFKLMDAESGIKSKFKKANVEMWLKIRNILDDDQKEIWKKHFAKLGKRNDMSFNSEMKKRIKHGEKKLQRKLKRNYKFDDNKVEE